MSCVSSLQGQVGWRLRAGYHRGAQRRGSARARDLGDPPRRTSASGTRAARPLNRATNRSLGIIRPDDGSQKFFSKPAKDPDAEDRDVAEQVLQIQQSSFLEQPLTPLEKPQLAFGYRYKSSGHPHNDIVHDWEVQEAHRQYKHRYAGKALEHLMRMYGETIPTRNLHFIMGTMAAHPRTFIVIGLLRSGLDPAELAK
jgi:hypothetical protein